MMNSKQLLLTLSFSVLAVATSGCATIVNGRDANVTVTSNPPQAHVAIKDQAGHVVATGMTPMQVTLDRSRGLLKKPPRYTAELQKPGFKPQKIAIKPTLSPWIAGNLVLGGPIGVVADSATGAMWNLKPNRIDRDLRPMQGPYYSQSNHDGNVREASFASDSPQN